MIHEVVNAFYFTPSIPQDVLAYATQPTSNVFDFTGLDISIYQRVILYLDGVTVDTANTSLLLQFYIGGVLQTSGYRRVEARAATEATTSVDANQTAPAIVIDGAADTGSNRSTNFRATITNSNASLYKQAIFEMTSFDDAPKGHLYSGCAILEQSGTLDGLKVTGSGGLITAGQAMLLGIPKS